MPLHQDALGLSAAAGRGLQFANYASFLTDTTVAAADTVAGLRTALAAAAVHKDVEPARNRISRAIDMGVAAGELTDAAILSLTTVAGLIALLTGLPSGDKHNLLPIG